MRIYTRSGDDGTTGLRAGERRRKDDALIALLGDLDESQAALGLARAEAPPAGALDSLLLRIERDLWRVMAEVASPLAAGEERTDTTLDPVMVDDLEREIDAVKERLDLAPNFSVPGGGRLAAALDFSRTVVRRAERAAVAQSAPRLVLVYLNRLSDLCWALARDNELDHRIHQASPTAGGDAAKE